MKKKAGCKKCKVNLIAILNMAQIAGLEAAEEFASIYGLQIETLYGCIKNTWAIKTTYRVGRKKHYHLYEQTVQGWKCVETHN